MDKISTEIRYKDMSFELVKEVRGLRLFINKADCNYCIVVDKEGNVLFKIRAQESQSCAYLENADEE
jgi:hypothetical protein